MGNQAEKEQQQSLDEILQMVAISDATIDKGDFSKEEIYQLRDGDRIIGKFWSYDLKNLIKTYPELFRNELQIASLEADVWIELFTHPLFQRRAPEIVPEQQPETVPESYMVRLDGETFGPVTREEIDNHLKDNSLLFTDLISVDGGLTWAAIHKRAEFDRRKRSAEQLPTSPENDIFALSQFEAMTNLIEKKDDDNRQTLNVIAGLAYVGQVHDGKIIAEEEHKTEQEYETSNISFPSSDSLKSATPTRRPLVNYLQNKNIIISLASFLIITIGIIWTLNSDNSIVQRTPASTIKVKKQAKIYRPVPSPIKKSSYLGSRSNDKQASHRVSGRRKNVVRSKTSFRDSDIYRDHAANYNEDDRYENNVEQDPVQASLSKDIIDPEDAIENIRDDRSMQEEFTNGPDEDQELFDSSYVE